MTFVKGQSGNPAGKPPGTRSFTTKVREALEKIADSEQDVTNETLFIRAILDKSIKDKDVGMMRTVWEQLDGKPIQRMANADGSNLKISFDPIFNAKPASETTADRGESSTV